MPVEPTTPKTISSPPSHDARPRCHICHHCRILKRQRDSHFFRTWTMARPDDSPTVQAELIFFKAFDNHVKGNLQSRSDKVFFIVQSPFLNRPTGQHLNKWPRECLPGPLDAHQQKPFFNSFLNHPDNGLVGLTGIFLQLVMTSSDRLYSVSPD